MNHAEHSWLTGHGVHSCSKGHIREWEIVTQTSSSIQTKCLAHAGHFWLTWTWCQWGQAATHWSWLLQWGYVVWASHSDLSSCSGSWWSGGLAGQWTSDLWSENMAARDKIRIFKNSTFVDLQVSFSLRVCMQECMYVHVCVCLSCCALYACMRACVCVCVCACMCACVCACACMCACVSVCLFHCVPYACVCACVCVFVCLHARACVFASSCFCLFFCFVLLMLLLLLLLLCFCYCSLGITFTCSRFYSIAPQNKSDLSTFSAQSVGQGHWPCSYSHTWAPPHHCAVCPCSSPGSAPPETQLLTLPLTHHTPVTHLERL